MSKASSLEGGLRRVTPLSEQKQLSIIPITIIRTEILKAENPKFKN
jgi:hypothetical protein